MKQMLCQLTSISWLSCCFVGLSSCALYIWHNTHDAGFCVAEVCARVNVLWLMLTFKSSCFVAISFIVNFDSGQCHCRFTLIKPNVEWLMSKMEDKAFMMTASDDSDLTTRMIADGVGFQAHGDRLMGLEIPMMTVLQQGNPFCRLKWSADRFCDGLVASQSQLSLQQPFMGSSLWKITGSAKGRWLARKPFRRSILGFANKLSKQKTRRPMMSEFWCTTALKSFLGLSFDGRGTDFESLHCGLEFFNVLVYPDDWSVNFVR